MKRRNVLLITTDQQRWDTVDAAREPLVPGLTPHLNALAGQGTAFRNAYTPNPVCIPARLAILTGCMPHRFSTNLENDGVLKNPERSVAKILGDQGYQTGVFGKTHFLPYAHPRTLHGFQHAELNEEGRFLQAERDNGVFLGGEDYADYLREVGWGGYQRAHAIGGQGIELSPSPVPAEHYESTWAANRCMEWIGQAQSGREEPAPFFAWLSFTRPHPPFDPPEPYHRLFDPREMPRPVGAPEDLTDKNPVLCKLPLAYGWTSRASPEHTQLLRAYYCGLVRFIDEQIGRVLLFLKERGLEEETLVIFTSDHGELLGDFGLFFKGNLLEPSIRVPFLIRNPDCSGQGQIREDLVSLVDIVPTILDYTGVRGGASCDGLSVLGAPSGDRSVVSYTSRLGGISYALRQGAWKYVWNEYDGIEELYDLDVDPRELKNLAASSNDRLASFRAMLAAWCQANGCLHALEDNVFKAKVSGIPLPDPMKWQGHSLY